MHLPLRQALERESSCHTLGALPVVSLTIAVYGVAATKLILPQTLRLKSSMWCCWSNSQIDAPPSGPAVRNYGRTEPVPCVCPRPMSIGRLYNVYELDVWTTLCSHFVNWVSLKITSNIWLFFLETTPVRTRWLCSVRRHVTGLPSSGHMKSNWRRTDIGATSSRRIDVRSTSLRRYVPAGYVTLPFPAHRVPEEKSSMWSVTGYWIYIQGLGLLSGRHSYKHQS